MNSNVIIFAHISHEKSKCTFKRRGESNWLSDWHERSKKLKHKYCDFPKCIFRECHHVPMLLLILVLHFGQTRPAANFRSLILHPTNAMCTVFQTNVGFIRFLNAKIFFSLALWLPTASHGWSHFALIFGGAASVQVANFRKIFRWYEANTMHHRTKLFSPHDRLPPEKYNFRCCFISSPLYVKTKKNPRTIHHSSRFSRQFLFYQQLNNPKQIPNIHPSVHCFLHSIVRIY